MKGENDTSLNDLKPPETFQEVVTKFFDEFLPALELLFARELPTDKKQEIKEKLEQLRTASDQFARKVEAVKKSGNMMKFAELSNDYIRAIIPEAASAISGLEYARSTLFSPAQIEVPYIRNSKYGKYVECIKGMIDAAMEKGVKQVISYVSSVANEVTDLQAWGQSLAVEMGRIVKHLTPDRTRFSRGLALRCIDEYGKMSGIYERLVKIIAGFVSIRPGGVTNYNKFRKQTLAANLGVIEDNGWGTILGEFDILVRNSIAHRSYTLYPNEKSVYFRDSIRGQEKSLSYHRLFEMTRDLSCLVLALSKFVGLFYEAIIRHVNSFLKPAKNV
jgi:hypothetical protein